MVSRVRDDRSKFEFDVDFLDFKVKSLVKIRSYIEIEIESGEKVEEFELELEEGVIRIKIFAFRLLVKSKSIIFFCREDTSFIKDSKEYFFDFYRNFIEFFEEISDEVFKLVDRFI